MTDGQPDRRTKWSLSGALLRWRHKNYKLWKSKVIQLITKRTTAFLAYFWTPLVNELLVGNAVNKVVTGSSKSQIFYPISSLVTSICDMKKRTDEIFVKKSQWISRLVVNEMKTSISRYRHFEFDFYTYNYLWINRNRKGDKNYAAFSITTYFFHALK